MKELDLKVEEDAIKRANEAVFDIIEENEKEKAVKRKEKELEDLIDQMAMAIIDDNKSSVGSDVADRAIEKIAVERGKRKTKEKEEKDDEQKTKKTTRRKSTKSI